MILGSSFVYANPIVLSDADIAILPTYLWTGAIVILLVEALSVAFFLSLKITKFFRLFLVLFISNIIVFTLFSKWLIIVGRYDLDINLSTILAEFAIIIIEALCIYQILITKFFLKIDEKVNSISLALFISFCSNSVSGCLGFFFSLWAYHHLYSLGSF